MSEPKKYKVNSVKSGSGLMWIYSNLNYILFLVFLAFIYIFNAHFIEKKLQKINRLESEVREAQWMYLDAKSELMRAGSIQNIETQLESEDLNFVGELPVKLKVPEQ